MPLLVDYGCRLHQGFGKPTPTSHGLPAGTGAGLSFCYQVSAGHCFLVDITSPTLDRSPASIPTENDGGSPAEEVPIPGRYSTPSPEYPLPLGLALDQADQAMKRIDRSNAWQGAVGRIKWVMDTLSPIAEVRVIPF